MADERPIVVTGASGYVEGRLVARLAEKNYRIRAMGRSIENMAQKQWACNPSVELVRGGAQSMSDLSAACRGCSAAFYLAYSMAGRKGHCADEERRCAMNIRQAAAQNNLDQIIYLEGLGDVNNPGTSRHLASQHEAGLILEQGPVQVTTLRAAMILGSGSASFEILRYLAERQPLMVTPRWVYNKTQPIAITNVLDYLEGCLQNRRTWGRSFDVGGPDVLDFRDLIRIYCDEARLAQRKLFAVPVLTPSLSARWIQLVTPIPACVALHLTKGLSVPTICRENEIEHILPIRRISCRQAIRTALDRILERQAETCWSDAGALNPPEWAVCGDAEYAGGTVLSCSYRAIIKALPEQIWKTITRIGGTNGYFFADWLWRLRGMMDNLVGGVGLRRGRRDPLQVKAGDALDFWRVLTAETNRRLTLVAEMKAPGEAVLDLQIVAVDDETVELRMISRFLPRGLAGLVYWYTLYPFHAIIFKGMLRAIASRSGAAGAVNVQALGLKHQAHCAIGRR